VAKYLKTLGYTVKSSADFLFFNSYSIYFDAQFDYVTVYNPYVTSFSISLPYQVPSALLAKINSYFTGVAACEFTYKVALPLSRSTMVVNKSGKLVNASCSSIK
jgi:hypothetical protein